MPPTAPTPSPQSPKSPPPPPKDDATLRRELEEMENRNAGVRAKAEGIMQEIEDKELRQTLGLEIEFDVSKLVTQGIVEKRGIQVMDGLFIDMHTLTKEEDILSEQLIEHIYKNLGGGIKLSKPYYEAKATAMLAMAITRCNNKLFPAPPADPAKQKSPEFEKNWDGKVELFNLLLKLPAKLVDAISFVYVNLSQADVLVGETNQKKSGRP